MRGLPQSRPQVHLPQMQNSILLPRTLQEAQSVLHVEVLQRAGREQDEVNESKQVGKEKDGGDDQIKSGTNGER